MIGAPPGKPAPPKASSAAKAASPAGPPGPLLNPTSGNVITNAVADIVNKTAAPFQNLKNPDVGAFEKAQAVVGAVAGLASAPTDFANQAFAGATNSISQALPSFPAAVIGGLVMGMPHTHTHPPSLIPPAPPIPLPAIGSIMTGCPTVLICGMPAARSGDYGIAPTCGALTPVFEIMTGSSKVFIGGERAARMLDITRQCAPPAGGGGGAAAGAAAGAAKAASAVGKAVSAAQKVVAGAGKVSQAMGIIGAGKKILDTRAAAKAAAAKAEAADEAAEAQAEAAADAASAAAEASAAILAAAMMGADLAMGAMKKAMGAMLGKDPGAPPCIGAITIGMPTVLIGGFPMPSWSAIAKGLKKLIAALKRGRRGGVAQGKAFCLKCM